MIGAQSALINQETGKVRKDECQAKNVHRDQATFRMEVNGGIRKGKS